MPRPLSRAFTLVEMLVVLGIIAVLAALLLPAAMGAVTRARNAAIGIEVNQLATAVESYKDKVGDYPPTFRGYEAFKRHVQKCYPKISPQHFGQVELAIWGSPPNYASALPTNEPNMDEGEALVFWLSKVGNDPREPFMYLLDGKDPASPDKFYEFDETRLVSEDTNDRPSTLPLPNPSATPTSYKSYQAKFCKEKYYVYIDSRAYVILTANFRPSAPTNPVYAYAEDSSQEENAVRPYWSNNLTPEGQANGTLAEIFKFKPMNPTTFQILCPGQDGHFGFSQSDDSVKLFPTGDYYTRNDRDNITNFSAGKRLEDSVK